MPVKRIEALADAIAYLNNMHDPSSRAYQYRNPGLLRSYSLRTLVNTDKDMVRIMDTKQGGDRALLSDLERKCKGELRVRGANGAVLTSDSKLVDILWTLGIRHSLTYNKPVEQAVQFLRVAVGDDSIDEDTPLKYFLEN